MRIQIISFVFFRFFEIRIKGKKQYFRKIKSWIVFIDKAIRGLICEKVYSECVNFIHILDSLIYRSFWRFSDMDILLKIYPGILGVSEIGVIFFTYFSKEGGMYVHFSKIGSQNLDYFIVLRYNFGCCQN